MSDDLDMFSESSDDSSAIDADIALMAAFLARELSAAQIAEVHDRLESDATFREMVQPLMEGWTFHGTGDAHAIAIASERVQRATTLTVAEIEAGWRRYSAEPSAARAHALKMHPSETSVSKQQWWRSMLRVAAIIAVIALPIAVSAKLLMFGAKDGAAPGPGAAEPGPATLSREQPEMLAQKESKFQLGKREEGRAVRDPKYDLLVARLDELTMNISVAPFASQSADPGGGLRSALFHVSAFPMEPHSYWPDGSYSTGAALISKEDMLRLLDVLDRGGFLATAESFYSEATDKPRGPPPASNDYKVYAKRVQKSPGSEVRLNSHDDNYHTYHIILPSLEKQLVPLLTELRAAISDSSAKVLLTQLLATSNMKVPSNK